MSKSTRTAAAGVAVDNRFAVIPHWVLGRGLSSAAIHLYVVLVKYADNSTGEAWPSRETLANDIGKSKDSVDRYIRELVAAGALAVTRRRRAGTKENYSNLYTVITANPDAVAPPAEIEVNYDPAENEWFPEEVAAPVRPRPGMDAAENYTHSTTPTRTSQPSSGTDEAEKTAAPRTLRVRAALSLQDQLHIDEDTADHLLQLAYRCWHLGDDGPWTDLEEDLQDAAGIGKDIRDARESLDWSQHRLAREAGVSRPTIARVETGSNISTGTLEKVARALGKHLRIDA